MRRRVLAIQVLVGLIGAMFVGQTYAEELAVTDLVCETGDDLNDPIPISVDPLSTQDAAYKADRENMQLIFYPDVARELPKAVTKFDFARACLEVIDRESNPCAAVKFLDYQGAIDKGDVSQLEDYFVGIAERNAKLNPKKTKEAYYTIKQIFSCF